MRRVRWLSLAAVLLIAAGPVRAAESLAFTSHHYENFTALLMGAKGAEVAIKGQLWLPEGPGPFKTAVIAHSCGGWIEGGEGERYEIDAFNKAGWAALVYDSFQPRDMRNVCGGGGGQAAAPGALADAYAALAALSMDSRIRQDRIILTGASFGGMTAWMTGFERVRKPLSAGDLKFAAHVGFYPSADVGFLTPQPFTGAPLLLLMGEDDDWTPAKRMQLLIDYQKSHTPSAPEIVSITYPRAHHGWLNVSRSQLARNNMGRTKLTCPVIFYTEVLGEFLLVGPEGKEERVKGRDEYMKRFASCMAQGVSMQGSASVSAQSFKDTFEFLDRVLP
jgi:dienelactone hydrolase